MLPKVNILTMLTDEEIYETIKQITNKYKLFECQACADEIKKWLQENNISATYIKLVAHHSDFIISKRVGYHQSITLNGIHYGIEIKGTVFDNLPNTGLSKQAWLNDFESLHDITIEESKIE